MKNVKKTMYFLVCAYIIINPFLTNNFKISSHLSDLVLVAIIVLYVLYAINERDKFILNIKDFLTDFLGMSFCLLLAIMFISISYASDKRLAFQESSRFLSFVVLYFIIKYNSTNKHIKGYISSYIVSFVLVNIFGIVQKLTGYGLEHKYYMSNKIERIQATFDNPNAFAAFLVIGVFPIIMMIVKYKKWYQKFIYVSIFLITMCNIYFSGSRNSFIAIIFGGIVIALFYNWSFFIGLIALVGVGFLVPQVKNRILEIGNMSLDQSRIKIWKTALKMIQEHPLLGVGNGNYIKNVNSYVQKYKQLSFPGYESMPCHNSFLKVESELGLIGGLAFISSIINIVIKVKKVTTIGNDIKIKLFYIGFIASISGFLVMNFFEALFFLPKVVVYFWIFAAGADALTLKNE